MEPIFRKKADGSPNLCDSKAALCVKEANKKKPWARAISPEKVKDSARRAVLRSGGDPGNAVHVLGQHELQFGVFRGQTFKWVAENALGYAGYLVADMKKESSQGKDSINHAENKKAFRSYVERFPEGRYAVRIKTEKMSCSSTQSASLPCTSTEPNISPLSTDPMQACTSTESSSSQLSEPVQSSDSCQPSVASVSSLRTLLVGRGSSTKSLEKTVKRLISPSKFKPSVSLPSFEPTHMDDSELVMAAEQVESELTVQSRICLPAGWKPALPIVDQQWISKALFKWSRNGQPELDHSKVDKMWWHPPQPSLTPSGVPAMERYFGHALFLWMPRKLWHVRLFCPHPDCGKEELTSAGVHQRIRQVVGISSSYFMAAEYLACKSCKRKVISWSHNIVCQLDIGHRVQFPCFLTSKLACDIQVVRQMRQRGLGNSSSQLQKQMEEQHSEAWLEKQVQYLTDCKGLVRAASSGLITPVVLGDLPPLLQVPKHRWLMQVYAQDVLNRLEEVKASITSQFGRVLKMDSTKKIVRKLAGQSRATAAWATNVGNEHGQVIMSVLTASEGYGLGKMIDGIMKRYRDAGVSTPEVLYVDRDCCGATHLRNMFKGWEDMEIRLDIWHYMRRIAVGCTTDSHVLYAGFMNSLSHCIFMWDESDLQALKEAKRSELEAKLMHPTDAGVMRNITRAEMALHCKRTTRSCEDIKALVTELIRSYDGEKGCNTLGVPLINSARMAEIWSSQTKHIACIQDPPGVQLYMQTGTILKGGHSLPTYRCARGSTSLESFHLHMNRFIPGTLASDTFFQAYLVDGLARWNEDRRLAAAGKDQPHSYSGLLKYAANQLSQEVLGRTLVDYTGPRKYTGELIGVEYLYEQTGSALEDYKLVILALETEDVTVAEDEGFEEAQDFEDLTVPAFETEPPAVPSASDASSGVAFAPPVSISAPPVSISAPPVSISTPPVSISTPPVSISAPPVSISTPPVSISTPPVSISTPPVSISTPPVSISTPPVSISTPPVSISAPPVSISAPPVSISAPLVSPPAPSNSNPTSALVASPSQDDSVGPDNIEGYRAVQNLADYLVTLKDHSFALSLEESSHIITLWQALSDYDKQRMVYAPRHQATLNKGRFRVTKKIVAPGVESTRRCFVGANSPAQWPDCNRVVEAIFVRLCITFPNPKNIGGVRFGRWTLICRAYKHIRECVLSNAHVMQGTTIQLPEVNATTLSEWYCRRTRSQESDVLHQGIMPPEAPVSGPTTQRSTPQKDSLASHPSTDSPHVFVLPPDTAGTAKLKRRLTFTSGPASSAPPQQNLPAPPQCVSYSMPTDPGFCLVYVVPGPGPDSHSQVVAQGVTHIMPATASHIMPATASHIMPATASHSQGVAHIMPATASHSQGVAHIMPATASHSQGVAHIMPATAGSSQGALAVTQMSDVPYTTQQYRKRKLKNEMAGIKTRKYVRHTSAIICRRCQKERKPPTHQQYFGNWYCEETDTMSLEDWKAMLVARGYGKKKAPK
ncbi:uncharacterized protein LOC143526077 [Brachyhypopomus gauderio]|uniref:uncharacterized protein LOC143526077 n=1 Tax=Brachyhypopomus gauderio TaxID=698409 RepID=UPI00404143C1